MNVTTNGSWTAIQYTDLEKFRTEFNEATDNQYFLNVWFDDTIEIQRKNFFGINSLAHVYLEGWAIIVDSNILMGVSDDGFSRLFRAI